MDETVEKEDPSEDASWIHYGFGLFIITYCRVTALDFLVNLVNKWVD